MQTAKSVALVFFLGFTSIFPAWGRRVKCLCVARATLRVDSAFEHSGASFLTYLTRGPLCATCAAVSSAVTNQQIYIVTLVASLSGAENCGGPGGRSRAQP